MLSHRLTAPLFAMQAIAFFMSPRSYIRLACMTFLASVLAAYWAVFIPKVHPGMRRCSYLVNKRVIVRVAWKPPLACFCWECMDNSVPAMWAQMHKASPT